ncbi:hypothetical protein [Ectopseudomonas alcaliphila]|uniref:hypothetical protein n=1 Tax=Ectopseudomonas alcaliphila TaxID=101564 RepID=UPI002787BCA2|nr:MULTISPECIES: hypothetical protein [Pseudomonas]MDP9941260.1 hypothetical protein [Pseudomonas sp. 3400]MDR7013479.1 hypothetical protein [Pseudomonas alcaliphila]
MRTFKDVRVYIAGGVVRNVLMGNCTAPKDFDFFLQGGAVASMVECFSRCGSLQTTPYGSPRWYPSASEQTYADLIPVMDFKPGLWPCEDIIDVLNQFDFTANAVAYDLRTGEVIDPQNGARDAARSTMKMVRFDYPEGPYLSSASLDRNIVLWFRVIHYASSLDLTIEPLTMSWLRARADYRAKLDEFTHLFFQPDLRVLETVFG